MPVSHINEISLSSYVFTHGKTYELMDISLICDTGINELFEFINQKICWLIFIAGLAVVTLYAIQEIFFLKCSFPSRKSQNKILYIQMAASFLLLISSLLTGNLIGTRFLRQTAKEYFSLLYRGKIYEKEYYEGRKNAIPLLAKSNCKPMKNKQSVTGILIIGESATSKVMNCYNFPIKNTPFLSRKLKENGQEGVWVKINECFALDNLTSKTFHQIISNSDYSNLLRIKESVLLYDVCRYAGIPTYSISNQVADGTSIGHLDSAADHSRFSRIRIKNSLLLDRITSPDEILLPMLENLLNELDSSKDNLIVLHLFGSHFPYKNRFPENYSTLLKKGDLSEIEYNYIKSIEYTDSILKRIFCVLTEKISDPFMICYVSDHGEDPAGKMMRGSRKLQGNIPEFFKVPCIFFLSRKYCELYPEKVSNLKENSCKPFINEHIFHAFVDFFEISIDDTAIHTPEKSIFSSQYKQDLSQVRILDYTYPLHTILKKNIFKITDQKKIIKSVPFHVTVP